MVGAAPEHMIGRMSSPAPPAKPLPAHVAALAVVLVALFPLMHPDSAFTSDEGAYALQTKALEEGSWAYEYKAASLDPDGRAFPVILSERGPSGYYPYVKHPAYPLLLRAATGLVGPTVGLHLLALLGVIGTAAAAWLLATELEPRFSRTAFWLAASGPVLANGFVNWAHAPSAALAGLAIVGAARVLRTGGLFSWAAAGTAAALVGGVLLRSEGLLFAAALGIAMAITLYRRDRRAIAALVLPALVVGPAVAAAVAERQWISLIVGRSYEAVAGQGSASTSFLAGRRTGAWHELMQAHFIDPAAAVPVMLALIVLGSLGFVALRSWSSRSTVMVAAGSAVAVVLLFLRFAAHRYDPVTGLLPAWPLVVLGLLLFKRKGASPVAQMLAGTAVLFTGAVLATQYPEGGGVEWGGRFLSPAIVAFAVLAATGLVRALDAAPSVDRPRVVAALVAVAVATAALSLATVGTLRARQDGVIAALARHQSPVTVTTHRALPRLAWRADDRLTWMLTDDAGLASLMSALRARGVAEVTVVGHKLPRSALSAYPVLTEEHEPALRKDGIEMFEVSL